MRVQVFIIEKVRVLTTCTCTHVLHRCQICEEIKGKRGETIYQGKHGGIKPDNIIKIERTSNMFEKLSIGQSSLCESRRHNSVIVKSIVVHIRILHVLHPHPVPARMDGARFGVGRTSFISPIGSLK